MDKIVPLACPYITNGLTRYTFYATGETRSITSHITCNTKNVIYMVQCNRCNLQYIGETKRRLKDRFNDHRRAVDKNNFKSKSTTVSEHFLSDSNYSHTDKQLIPLEKIHSSRVSVRKARESHLIDKTMTLESHGLNHRNELLYYCIIEFVFFLSSFCVVRHFRLSLLNNLYATFTTYIILWLLHKFSNIGKPEEGRYGQPKYCYKKQYTLF